MALNPVGGYDRELSMNCSNSNALTGGENLMKRTILAVFAAILIMTIKPARAQSTWTIDPSHSAAQFQVKHLMISTVRGEFGKMSGRITFDGKNYATVKAEAVIEAASINTREPKRDDHLRSPDFFDTASHPTITFKSRRVESISGNKFNLVGDLTMRGVTKEVTLNVEATPIAKGMRGEPRIGAQATTRLNRQDYGVKWNQALDSGGVVVGNEVQITIDLELIQETPKP
jgi:polyisoprenoid-binding protein YceI